MPKIIKQLDRMNPNERQHCNNVTKHEYNNANI